MFLFVFFFFFSFSFFSPSNCFALFFVEGASCRRDQGEDHRGQKSGGAVPRLPAREQARLRRVAGLLKGRTGGEHNELYLFVL